LAGAADDALAELPIRSSNLAGALARTSARRFVGALGAALAAAGVGHVASGPRTAEAAYVPGGSPTGGDLVNTSLTVQNSLYVWTGRLGVGTFNPTTQMTVDGGADPYISLSVAQVERALIGYENTTGRGITLINRSAGGLGYVLVASDAGNVGIGTTAPVTKLDVAGAISVNGTQAIDSTATAKKSYYAP